jgi:hypothetical protein
MKRAKWSGIAAALFAALTLGGCLDPIVPPPSAQAASAEEQFAPYAVSVYLGSGPEADRSVAGPTKEQINLTGIRNYLQVIAVDKADQTIAGFHEVRSTGVSQPSAVLTLKGLVNNHTYAILLLEGHWERDYAKETGGSYVYTNNPPTLLRAGYQEVTFTPGASVTIPVWPIYVDTTFTIAGGLTAEPVVTGGKPGAASLLPAAWTANWKVLRGASGTASGFGDLVKAQKTAGTAGESLIARNLMAVVRVDGYKEIASYPVLSGNTITLSLHADFTGLSRIGTGGSINFALSFAPFNLTKGWAGYDAASVFDLSGGPPVWVIRNGINGLPQDGVTDFTKFGNVPIGMANGNGAVRFTVTEPQTAAAGELVASAGSWAASSVTFTTSGYTGTAQAWYAASIAPPAYTAYSLLGDVPAGTHTKMVPPLGMSDAFVVLVKDGKAGAPLRIDQATDFRLPSVAAVRAYLNSLTAAGDPRGDSADDPILLPMVMNLANSTDSLANLLSLIAEKEKYVSLDLSVCSMSGTEFNPDNASSTGKGWVVSLILPNTAQSIPRGFPGNPVFKYFTNLKAVSGSGRITTGWCAFEGSPALTTADFPAAVDIGNNAFQGCTRLTAANFPAATIINTNAFQGCSALTAANFPAATIISTNAFQGCSALTAVNFPAVTSLGNNAFSGCTALTTVTAPKAAAVGAWAFEGCTALTAMNLPAVTSIGESAFLYCSALTQVNFPAVVSLGGAAFAGCTALTAVTAPKATAIGAWAFNQCAVLKTASLPKATTIGERAFLGCSALTAADFPEAASVGAGAFNRCAALKTANLSKAAAIGEYTFQDCPALTTVTAPKAAFIGIYAFNRCAALTAADFPAATYIERYAFEACTSLAQANFPEAVTVYANRAFSGCTVLKTVNLPKATFIGNNTFRYCTALTEVNLSSIEKIDFSAFFEIGTGSLTITMPFVAPWLPTGANNSAAYNKTVTIRRPPGSVTYNQNFGEKQNIPWRTLFENLFGYDALIAVNFQDI